LSSWGVTEISWGVTKISLYEITITIRNSHIQADDPWFKPWSRREA